MKKEFKMKQVQCLDDRHQKEIYEMHTQLMQMKNASECTPELQEIFMKKLKEMSDYYSADSN